MTHTARIYGLLAAVGLGLAGSARADEKAARVEITVLDQATGKPVPCRVHLKDAAGKPQRLGGPDRLRRRPGLRVVRLVPADQPSGL